MSITYFCPSCWSEVGGAATCPNCGADLHNFAGYSYEEKLIRALRHPEPTAPIRAATILGELRSRAAVEPLLELATGSPDPYIQEAAVEALGRIRDTRALSCLDQLSRQGAVRVRAAAERALKTFEDRQNATKE
jgi:HEAT repeat protein